MARAESSKPSPKVYCATYSIYLDDAGMDHLTFGDDNQPRFLYERHASGEVAARCLESGAFSCQFDVQEFKIGVKLNSNIRINHAFGYTDPDLWIDAFAGLSEVDDLALIRRVRFDVIDTDGQRAMVERLPLKETPSFKESGMKKGDIIVAENIFKVRRERGVTLKVEIEYEEFPAFALNSNTKPDELQRGYLQLLQAPKDANFTFHVGDEKIPAHKNILSVRSTYFANMFESGMRENATHQARITDVEPPVFRAMLEYLYAGLWPKAEMALDLLLLADKYGIDGLKEKCSSILYVDLCSGDALRRGGADSIVEILAVAERLDCKQLTNRARSVLQQNVAILSDADCAKLQEDPKLLFEIFKDACGKLFPREARNGCGVAGSVGGNWNYYRNDGANGRGPGDGNKNSGNGNDAGNGGGIGRGNDNDA